MSDKKVSRVVLIMAMEAEAMPVVQQYSMKKTALLNPKLPLQCYCSKVGVLEFFLVINGRDERYGVDYIGSEPATLAAYESITKLSPDLVISAGTAGGFSAKGAEVGTVYLSKDKFVFHDRHVPLKNFDESAVGNFPALDVSRMAKDLGLPQGIISTGSSLKKLESDVDVIEENNAVAKEMEVAALAWVAMIMEIPCFAIKSITNLIDQKNASEEEFVANLNYSVQTLLLSLNSVIEYVDGKTISDLKF